MCRLGFIGAFVRMLVLVGCMALTLFMPNMLVGLAVWPLIWLVWQRLPDHERMSAPSVIELLPFAVGAQAALDSLVPYLGDVTLLVGNVMIVAALRRPKVPQARVHRVPDMKARQARVQRVMFSREAAVRAASACGGARRAS